MHVHCMAEKVHKQEYTLNTMATLFNNHINSSGMPVGTKFTATYVGMIVE